MNPDTLEQLNSAYVNVQEAHGDRFRAVHEIDTGEGQNTTAKTTAYEVARSMIDQIKGKT